jgi:L-fuconate dehydratase
MSLQITEISVHDIRFPTSRDLDGSDAMNPDPDYSAAYVVLHTNDPTLNGYGLTFTIGRGNDVCVAAINAMRHLIVGKKLSDFTADMGAFWKYITGDSQLRWLGPDKGVIHLATAAVVNAVWDLWGRVEKKPLWQLLADMSPEEFLRCVDFSYITDAITPEEALEILKKQAPHKAERINYLKKIGYPAYITSAGWLGYSEEKVRRLCKEAVQEGWTHLKFKVGANLQDDINRLTIAREELGDERFLMIDANQKWDVPQAIEWLGHLAKFNPWWIEEPTSPDDVLGHAAIRQAVKPMGVATGEHCHNRIMFKQLMQAGAIDFCQIDSCRLGGVNEILAVLLMAAKFNIPVCPHAGGVGLCEYVQHLSMVDYICISGSLENRVIEYVDHLHEHFKAPVVMRNGHYQLPTMPGYSIEMHEATLQEFRFPEGAAWKQ